VHHYLTVTEQTQCYDHDSWSCCRLSIMSSYWSAWP